MFSSFMTTATTGSHHAHAGMLVVNRVGEDGHDDGLVHSHGWAAADAGMDFGGFETGRGRSSGNMLVINRVGEDGHDDGLVHAHEWAAAK